MGASGKIGCMSDEEGFRGITQRLERWRERDPQGFEAARQFSHDEISATQRGKFVRSCRAAARWAGLIRRPPTRLFPDRSHGFMLAARTARDELAGRTDDAGRLASAMTRLDRVDPCAESVFEVRYLAGLLEEETAEVLEITPRTAKRAWHIARAWLHREPGGGDDVQRSPA